MSSRFTTRKLARNHLCEQPSRIMFLDCETLPTERPGQKNVSDHTFRLGVTRYVARDRGNWKRREETVHIERNAMWSHIFSKCHKRSVLWVIAHNALFDLTVSGFWAYVDGGDVILNGNIKYHTGQIQTEDKVPCDWAGLFVADDKRLIVQCCHRGGRINIVDSMNYYRCPLDELGESIGYPKQLMPAFDDDDDTWAAYCSNDVAIIQHSITSLLDRWKAEDNGNWQPTAASLAWSNYRHKFLDSEITTHNDKTAADLEHAAHYGGECRAFFIGDVLDEYSMNVWEWMGHNDGNRPKILGPCHLYDVRSLYPHVMSHFPMPVRLIHSQTDSTPAKLIDLAPSFWTIAKVDLDTTVDRFPCRMRMEKASTWQDRLTFPIGKFRTTLCGDELRDALNSGFVTGSYEFAVYDSTTCFERFVNHWYARKLAAEKNGDRVERELCKMMLNSLYGRFAMGKRRFVLDQKADCLQHWGYWIAVDGETRAKTKFRGIGGNVLRETEVTPGEHQLAAIAAAVTSAGRTFMRNARALMPPRSILYQDTDSLLVTDQHNELFKRTFDTQSDAIGHFKPVATFDAVEIWGAKNYTADGTNRIAGCPKGAIKTGERAYRTEVFEQGESILARPCPDTVSVKVQTMDFRCHHGGDVPTHDGWTLPIRAVTD